MIMPWKKRLKTTPNDVRRAWLLAAPFVLLGASKAEADTAFTNFAFARATGTGRVNRTMPARLDDIYNVKDFGALGTGRGDDQPSIQAAINACVSTGGAVYFPRGSYLLARRLVVGTNASGVGTCISLIGQGGYSGVGGSLLLMGGVRDYMIYCMHGPATGGTGGGGIGTTVRIVEKLNFENGFSGASPTTTEPPNSPDIVVNVISTTAGTSGRVRLLVNQLLDDDPNPPSGYKTFNNGQSIVVAGVSGGTAGVNGTHTVAETGYVTPPSTGPYIELTGTTHSSVGTGGTVRYNGDGCGCLYMSGGTGNVIRDCNFNLGTGIGVFYHGFMGVIDSCEFNGGNTGTYGEINQGNPTKTIGILTRSSAIRGGKFTGCGTAVCMIMGSSSVESLDVERSAIGFQVGKSPISWWESNWQFVIPPSHQAFAQGGFRIGPNVIMEACNNTFVHVDGNSYGSVDIKTMHSSGQIGIANYALRVVQGGGTYSISAGGAYAVAAFDISGANSADFIGCNSGQGNDPSLVGANASGVNWTLPTGGLQGGIYFEKCDIEGAFPLSIFPSQPSFNSRMRCSNSVDPVWTGTASNIGKRIVGSGTNTVLAQFSTVTKIAAAASWVAGTTESPVLTIAMSATTSLVQSGMGVWDDTNSHPIGVVSSYVGTTLTLVGPTGAQNASKTSTDVLRFSTWVIAG